MSGVRIPSGPFLIKSKIIILEMDHKLQLKRQELEHIKKWLSELQRESKRKPIIVEGKKDKEALANLGIQSMQLHQTHKSLTSRIEEIAHLFEINGIKDKECIILFDLDREGRKLYDKIRGDLNQVGIRVNGSYRNFLLYKTRLKFIDGIDTYVNNLTRSINH